MDDLIRNPSSRRRAASAFGAALLLLFAAAGSGAANAPSLDDDFTWSADVLNSDLRNDTLDISGNVLVRQGASSIEAQTARKRNVNAATERWTFEDSVHIRTTEADLQSNLATAAVINGQISNARVEGNPARFQQVSATDNRQVRGRAGVIEYDFDTGVVKLSDQVWFSNGKDEFRGDVVIYNVRDQRVQINPGGSSNRVRGIIRPNQDKSRNNSGGTPGTAAIVEPAFNEPGLNENGLNENGETRADERVEPRLAIDKSATDKLATDKLATERGGGA